MSAEVPKNGGAGEPLRPQRTVNNLFSSLQRFFGVLDRQIVQPPIQPTTQIAIQPPPGLEEFAAKIQQGINNHLTTQRQQEVERRDAEAARLSAEVEERAKVAQRKIEMEELEITREDQARSEADEILKDFRVAERLEYIRAAVWEGKGEIRPIEPQFGSEKGQADTLGGLELAFDYPTVLYRQEWHNGDSDGVRTSYEYFPGALSIPSIRSTRLRVDIIRDLENRKKMLEVTSDISFGHPVRILVDENDSKPLLEEFLVRDSAIRTVRGYLPSKLEKEGTERVATLKRNTDRSR